MSTIIFLILFLVKFSYPMYRGEYFPDSYLKVDANIPSEQDIDIYLDRLYRLTRYHMNEPNYTDVNQALAAFMSGALLKRTLRDYGEKISHRAPFIKHLIFDLSIVVSHYAYMQREKPMDNLEFHEERTVAMQIDVLTHNNKIKIDIIQNNRTKENPRQVSQLIKDDTSHVYAIGNFVRGVPKRWIRRYAPINDYVAEMDNITLPKKQFVKLVQSVHDGYAITGQDSDYCLSRLARNIDPVNITELKPCYPCKRCRDKIFLSPSIAYTLSHRQFNSMLYLHNRRCYHHSQAFDYSHMEMVCAHMYREMVYIARRGYFARDIFMEHLGLCGQMGYEEFHRRHWFHKVASWINADGCMQEFSNFDINRTMLFLEDVQDPKEIRQFRRMLRDSLDDECHHHHMAVAIMVFANAVRHAAHYLTGPLTF